MNSSTDHQALNHDMSTKKIKFLYSYGGKILPRPTDGMLRYVGGMTRILAVDHSISYAELAVKFLDCCGSSMSLRCKLPDEDLDVLVSVTSDEELASVIHEYENPANNDVGQKKWIMIRVILDPNKSAKKVSAPASPVNKSYSSASKPPKYPRASNVSDRHRFAKNSSLSPPYGRFCPSATLVAATNVRRTSWI